LIVSEAFTVALYSSTLQAKEKENNDCNFLFGVIFSVGLRTRMLLI